MRLSAKKLRRIGFVLAILAVVFVVVRTWVVPAVIRGQIQAHYRGKAVIGDWWFGLHSAGVSGVELHETEAADSPVWFAADRVSTDVSLSRLLRGRVMPTRIEIDRPRVAFRLDAKGQPLTKIPVAPSKGDPKPMDAASLPDIVTKNGEITLRQEGRKPMTITGVNARLAPVADGGNLDVTTDDPTWGQVKLAGHFDPTFKNGRFQIDTSPGFVADPEKLERIPFIPAEVWSNLEPRGPVAAKVDIKLAVDSPQPVRVHTDITLKGTDARLKTLQVDSHDTTGRVVIDDALVRIEGLKGKTLDGSISAGGKLDFGQKVPRFDLDLRLRDVDVTKAPKSWQLGEVGATGRLSGNVDLKVALDPAGPDLTGTFGRAVIENGSFQGIPVKSLSLGLKADRNDLQYATLPEGAIDRKSLDSGAAGPPPVAGAEPAIRPPAVSERLEIWDPLLAALPLIRLASANQGPIGWTAFAVSKAVELQVKRETGGAGGFRLPKTITTQIELADVELATIVAKVEKFGIKVPVPVAGKFSLKATATIPLGSLRDIKLYAFKGDLTLKGASIDHVDLGQVSAHVDLGEGVLAITDFRGQLVDKPAGGANNPPPPTTLPPAEGPLPHGGFRAGLRASISPRGPATIHFEGNSLPLGELFAPFLPTPTPLSGELSVRVQAGADVANLADGKSWSLDGRFDSRRIKYQDATLDEVATTAVLKGGHLDIPEFAARLAGQPFTIKGGVEVAPPYRYLAKVDVNGWEIAEVLKFIPGMPRPSPASGIVDARGEAVGAIQPFEIRTQGGARVLKARVGPAPLGTVAFRWETDRDEVTIGDLEVFAYGGKLAGEAKIPTKPGRPMVATATFKGIDAARLSAAFLDRKFTLSGKADGQLKVSMPLDASTIDADASLDAPDLKIREGSADGIPVKSLRVSAVTRDGVLDYDATAEGLGGKVRFHGSAPLRGDLAKPDAQAELLAVGFRLDEAWKGLGVTGALGHMKGVGAFDTNLRASIRPFRLWSHGTFELRDLGFGVFPAVGHLQGVASLSPTSWKVDQVVGELLGGIASGEARGESRPGGSKLVTFDFKVDRASLARMAAGVPSIAREMDGYGSLRLAGRFEDSLMANSEVLVPRAKAFGLPISDLRFPAELELNPATGTGSVNSRQWYARMAGGTVRGNAFLHLGEDRAFQADAQFTGVDIETFTRLHSNGKRSASGKISGKVALNGPDPERVDRVRGKFDVDLDDASLVEMPVFKELDRFLGSARGGGLFEDGDAKGTIFNRTLFVEQMTLRGRLLQVHATGTITLDGGLNLEVLVNTNEIIPQSGLALIGIIPGLGQALGRGEEALLRVANFLENRLLKFRVSGTMNNPSVKLDAGIAVGDTAAGFFSGVLKVPMGALR